MGGVCNNDAGAYSTMRTVQFTRILELETHLQRIIDALPVACPCDKPVDPDTLRQLTLRLLTETVVTFAKKYDGIEQKITVLAYMDDNARLKLHSHVCPLPQLALDDGIQVEIHGNPRHNAHAKNSQWVRCVHLV
jgi:hypothetical protein